MKKLILILVITLVSACAGRHYQVDFLTGHAWSCTVFENGDYDCTLVGE